jgi:DNA-binding CsgD family transcriptional regulator
MIHRDELKYTDDVIATLQSDNPLWYIANALNIDVKDVQFHYGEVFDLNHNGRVLPLRYAPEPPNVQSRTGGPRRIYKTTQIYPRDPQYWEERTATEIANELGQTVQSVKNFAFRWGFKTKRAIMGIRNRTDWPTNPAWYAIRSAEEIGVELGLAVTTVRKYAQMNKIKLRRSYRFIEWPSEREWFETRTTVQIAKILKTNIDAVQAHCRKRGFKTVPCRVLIDWPKDAAWYAERTRQEIAEELDVTYYAVAQHVWQYAIECKKDPKSTK